MDPNRLRKWHPRGRGYAQIQLDALPRVTTETGVTIEGPITAQVTASALQLHRDVIAILDEEAARLLERRDYYLEVERAQAGLQAG